MAASNKELEWAFPFRCTSNGRAHSAPDIAEFNDLCQSHHHEESDRKDLQGQKAPVPDCKKEKKKNVLLEIKEAVQLLKAG